jgi:hypothetical protein
MYGLIFMHFICIVLVLAVRGYITGSTSTSLWTVYNKGVRNYCGNDLPDGKSVEIAWLISICISVVKVAVDVF